jgi:hypothetical protein
MENIMNIENVATNDSTFEKAVLSTSALPSYNNVVQIILRDEKHDWKFDYFKPDGKSSCDVKIGRLKINKWETEANIKANAQLLVTLDKNIKAARLPPNHADYKKAKPAEISLWDKQYVQAEEDLMLDRKHIDALTELIEQWTWNQYLEIGRMNSLWRLRNKYKYDHDREFLEKGVTWACEYEKRHRHNVDLGPEGNASRDMHETWINDRSADYSAW